MNDKLVLLHNSNKSANVAIKTSSGTTERITIEDSLMQGYVWAGLMCTSTMDKLCKLILQNEHLVFKYRGKVSVPPLQMVDDVITTSKCGSTASALNAVVNTFMELKKQKLGVDKCATVHIGRKDSKTRCSVKKIQGEDMKQSEKEKYLGNFVSKMAILKKQLKQEKQGEMHV